MFVVQTPPPKMSTELNYFWHCRQEEEEEEEGFYLVQMNYKILAI